MANDDLPSEIESKLAEHARWQSHDFIKAQTLIWVAMLILGTSNSYGGWRRSITEVNQCDCCGLAGFSCPYRQTFQIRRPFFLARFIWGTPSLIESRSSIQGGGSFGN